MANKNFTVKNGLEVGGQEVISSSGVVTSAALGGQVLGTSSSPSFANITTAGYLRGPASFVIDPAAHGNDTGTVVIAGNLQVDGTQTTINSTTMIVDDLNITLASGATNAAAANGSGITIDGASANITYQSNTDTWDFNKNVKFNRVQAHGSNNFLIDSPAEIQLDSHNGHIRLRTQGGDIGTLQLSNNDLTIRSMVSDRDIIFQGYDGSTNITALTLDMSDGGAAHFGNDVRITDNQAIRFGNDQDFRIYSDGSNSYLVNSVLNQDLYVQGRDSVGLYSMLMMDMSARKSTFGGIVSSPSGFERGDMFITQNEIDVSSGNLTLDVAGDIILDADGGDILLKDGGTHWASVYTNGTNTYIQNMVNSGDVYLSGKDGSGNGVNALILDMSAAGAATFNSSVTAGTNFTFANNNTNNTNKEGHLLARQYASGTETEGFQVLQYFSNSSLNRIDIGGAASTYNAATAINFYTAANTTTRTGTQALTLDSSQNATFSGKITASATDSEFYNRLFIKNGTHGLYMGQWDTVNHRIEGDANRPISIQSYHTGTGILLGNSGNTKLQVHASGVSVTGTSVVTGAITTSSRVFSPEFRVMEGTALAGGAFKEKNVTGSGSSNDLTFFAESIANGGDIHFMTGGSTTKQLSISSTGEILMSGGSLAIAANAPGDSLVLMSNEVVVNQNSLDLNFRVESDNNTHALFVRGSDGKVGIGLNNPSAFLHVTGSEGSQYSGSFNNTSSQGWGLFVKGGADSADYSLRVQNKNAAELLAVKSNGNVGIGTSNPQNKLTITDGATPYSTSNALLQLKRNATNSDDDTSRAALLFGNNSNGFTLAYGGTTDRFRFINGGNVEQLTLLNGGNLGIGKTNPSYLVHAENSTATGQSVIATSANGQFVMAIGSQNSPGVAQEAFVGTLSDTRFKIKVNNTVKGSWTDNGLAIGTQSSAYTNLDVAGEIAMSVGNAHAVFSSDTSGKIFIKANENKVNAATAIHMQMPIVSGSGTLEDKLVINHSDITAYKHFLPNSDVTYDLGTATKRWRNIYTGDLHLSNEGQEEGNSVDGTKGNWTIQEGEEHLYIINNKSGKKYKFALEEIE